MNSEVDIVIIGAGVAGCIAAIALGGSYSVALIDKLSEPVERIGECLPPASRRILKQLNLLDSLEKNVPFACEPAHLQHIGTRSCWGSGQVQVVDHLRNPDGFGWHLDRRAFETSLRATALQRGANCCWPAKLSSAFYKDCRWHITATTDDNVSCPHTHQYTAKFVIDASGRQSHFARKTGIGRKHFDKLIACWAVLPNREQNKMSTISAGESGWWYTAPLPNSRRVLAFQTDSDLVDRSAIKRPDTFIELAQANSEMAAILKNNPGEMEYRGTVAANSTQLEQVAGHQWAALGDAAMSFDPLSSQGMFNGMACAMQLAELIRLSDLIKHQDVQKAAQFQAAYTNQMAQVWEHYIKHKNIFYGAERRWEDAAFWHRRH